jgi:hypothetical protein
MYFYLHLVNSNWLGVLQACANLSEEISTEILRSGQQMIAMQLLKKFVHSFDIVQWAHSTTSSISLLLRFLLQWNPSYHK